MKQNEFIEQESKEISILTTKQWEDADEEDAVICVKMRKNDIIQIGSYAVQLFNTIHDSDGYHALLFFDGKNSIKTNLFEGRRYNLGNGYYIFIRSISGKPEESVLLKIKRNVNKYSI